MGQVGEEEGDSVVDLVGDLPERGVRAPSPSPATEGSAMLQWAAIGGPGNSGQTSRTLSQSVITRSNRWRVKRLSGFVGRPAMSMPRSAITRTAFGCRAFGWLPALRASTTPPERCSTSASAICERALLPVHRNSRRERRRRGRASAPAGAGDSPGCNERGGGPEQVPAAEQVSAVVDVAAVGGAATGRDDLGSPELGEVVRDDVLRPGRRGPPTRRLADRCGRARPRAASGSDQRGARGSPAAQLRPRRHYIRSDRCKSSRWILDASHLAPLDSSAVFMSG